MSIISLSEVLKQVAGFEGRAVRAVVATGLAVRFLNAYLGNVRIDEASARIASAVNLGQFEMYFDRSGRPVAYLTWAFVDDFTQRAMLAFGPSAIERANWQGGTNLWVVDFFCANGFLDPVMRDLRDRVFSKAQTVTYFRYKSQRRLAKQIDRRDQTSFFCTHKRERRVDTPDAVYLQASAVGKCQTLLRDAHELGNCLAVIWRVMRDVRALTFLRSTRLLSEISAIRQFRLYFDENGVPSGIITWAWLSERTISRIKHIELQEADTSEWNEGCTLCICDYLITPVVAATMRMDVQKNLFPLEKNIMLYQPPQDSNPAKFFYADRETHSGVIQTWLTLQTDNCLALPEKVSA